METRSNSNTSQINPHLVVDPTFINLRLNTRTILKDLRQFLAAKQNVLIRGENGELIEAEQDAGKALANDEGINAILNMVLLRSNHHCIQGNFDRTQYENNICEARKEITYHIILNQYHWEIKDHALDYIIDNVMDFLTKITSRLLNNEERKSYNTQFNSTETHTERPQNLLKSFAGGASN